MQENSKAIAIPQTRGQQFLDWLEDPLGQVVAASVATIGSFSGSAGSCSHFERSPTR